jgi:ATP-dependent helicase/nuclease subunit A
MTTRITLVSASAGTGKTYRLGTALLDSVNTDTLPEAVLATTFTNRAAADLLARGRGRLMSDDLPSQALNLMLARIGTVNAVFGRVLADFALHNGRSPAISIIPDAAQSSIFRIAADPCIQKYSPILDRLSEKFEFFSAKANWLDMLKSLTLVARSNGISPADLTASADRSLTTLLKTLPKSGVSAEDMDTELLDAAKQAAGSIRSGGDSTDVTAKALVLIETTAQKLQRGAETWADWARLSKVSASAPSKGLLVAVRAAPSRASSASRRYQNIHPDYLRRCRRSDRHGAASQARTRPSRFR